jgi:hypothetical protein
MFACYGTFLFDLFIVELSTHQVYDKCLNKKINGIVSFDVDTEQLYVIRFYFMPFCM